MIRGLTPDHIFGEMLKFFWGIFPIPSPFLFFTFSEFQKKFRGIFWAYGLKFFWKFYDFGAN